MNNYSCRTEVGWAVPCRRQAMAISQEELASRCGLHRTYISEIERGLKSVSLKAILVISQALECFPHVLYQRGRGVLEGNNPVNWSQEESLD